MNGELICQNPGKKIKTEKSIIPLNCQHLSKFKTVWVWVNTYWPGPSHPSEGRYDVRVRMSTDLSHPYPTWMPDPSSHMGDQGFKSIKLGGPFFVFFGRTGGPFGPSQVDWIWTWLSQIRPGCPKAFIPEISESCAIREFCWPQDILRGMCGYFRNI